METSTVRTSLVLILQRAYSGEKAAALAYRGHWKSVNNPAERAGIKKIESEEWTHRAVIGEMLHCLGAKPVRSKEVTLWFIGRSVGTLCHITGWFLPMYFAGRLESQNTEEYAEAASLAGQLGLKEFSVELMAMSAVEKAHEMFFLEMAASHRLFPVFARVFRWGRMSPRLRAGSESTGPEPRGAAVSAGTNSDTLMGTGVLGD